ncbi:MAG: hypothetical protein CMJ58_20545 [Planctomycetaceae bacterium]|nr:hypothetical protein [Planctomycetaceae bacterium]
MPVRHLGHLLLGLLLATRCVPAAAAFDLQFTLLDNANGFTTTERALVQQAVDHAEAMWETVLLGYQNDAMITSVPITVIPTTSGLASATFSGTTSHGGFTYATSGFVNINVNEIENFADWQGPGANGLNFLDELMAHEVGHVLGIGTLWVANGNYANNTYQFMGPHAVAAYEAEFSDLSGYVPVENNGGPGTPNAHWDQMMRSSGEAGDPSNPWILSPLTGVVDQYGRDRALELMTGAIDPDYLEPFLSRTTVQSMRDLGYLVTEFEDANGDGAVDATDLATWAAGYGSTGLQIDSFTYGDADRNRAVQGGDFLLWQRAAAGAAATAIPEPAAWVLASLSVVGIACRRSR